SGPKLTIHAPDMIHNGSLYPKQAQVEPFEMGPLTVGATGLQVLIKEGKLRTIASVLGGLSALGRSLREMVLREPEPSFGHLLRLNTLGRYSRLRLKHGFYYSRSASGDRSHRPHELQFSAEPRLYDCLRHERL